MDGSTLEQFIKENDGADIDALSTDAQVLWSLLTLVVDIKFRYKYLKSFDYNNGKGYSIDIQPKKVLADQVSPVDNGLLG